MYNGIENLLKMRSHSYQKLGILCNVAKSLTLVHSVLYGNKFV